jgi:hypothetical protein
MRMRFLLIAGLFLTSLTPFESQSKSSKQDSNA